MVYICQIMWEKNNKNHRPSAFRKNEVLGNEQMVTPKLAANALTVYQEEITLW
jgi:hypothetical protein